MSHKNIERCFVAVNSIFCVAILLLYIVRGDGLLFTQKNLSSQYSIYATVLNVICSGLLIGIFFIRKNKENYFFKFRLPHRAVQTLFVLAILNITLRYDVVVRDIQFLAYLLSIILFSAVDSFLIEEDYPVHLKY
jgi:hypothetical protein